MPQMSPMMWSLLFIYFLTIFFIFNILNYFNFTPTSKQEIKNNKKMTLNAYLNWQW